LRSRHTTHSISSTSSVLTPRLSSFSSLFGVFEGGGTAVAALAVEGSLGGGTGRMIWKFPAFGGSITAPSVATGDDGDDDDEEDDDDDDDEDEDEDGASDDDGDNDDDDVAALLSAPPALQLS